MALRRRISYGFCSKCRDGYDANKRLSGNFGRSERTRTHKIIRIRRCGNSIHKLKENAHGIFVDYNTGFYSSKYLEQSKAKTVRRNHTEKSEDFWQKGDKMKGRILVVLLITTVVILAAIAAWNL